MVQDVYVPGIVEVLDLQELLHLGHPLLGQYHRVSLLVHGEVAVPLQVGDDAVDVVVLLGGFLRGAGDDQGGSGLIDQDRVHLIHDGVKELPLDTVLQGELHVVPQVVEAELVVGPVGDVGGVGLLPLVILHIVGDHPHIQTQEPVDHPHPLGIPPGQVVVDGDDVNPPAQQGVEVCRKGGHESLPLPCGHLRYLTLVKDYSTDELHIEVTLPEGTPGHLPHHGEGLGKELIEALPPLDPLLELPGLCPEFMIA